MNLYRRCGKSGTNHLNYRKAKKCITFLSSTLTLVQKYLDSAVICVIRFDVFKVVAMKNAVLWDMILQEPHRVILLQKTAFFIIYVVNSWLWDTDI
jgi:hypothetical protein